MLALFVAACEESTGDLSLIDAGEPLDAMVLTADASAVLDATLDATLDAETQLDAEPVLDAETLADSGARRDAGDCPASMPAHAASPGELRWPASEECLYNDYSALLADRREIIEEVFALWSAPCACLCLATPVQAPNDEHAARGSIRVLALDRGESIAIVWTTIEGQEITASTIQLRTDLSDDTLRGVLVHELGHALGFEHVEDARSVLHPTRPEDQLTEHDLAVFYAKYGLCGS